MIPFKRSDAKVELTFAIQPGYTIPFEFGRGCPMDAHLLVSQMQGDLYNRIEAIRREAYNQGWKDKQQRKQKQGYFSGNIQTINCT